MNAVKLMNVCRICPNAGGGEELLSIFDERHSLTYNLKEVILVTTGVEVLKDDIISKKICRKCWNITLKMFEFRQDALKQNKALKGMLNECLEDKFGIKLPNTCITIKKDKADLCSLVKAPKAGPSCSSITKEDIKNNLHPSVVDLYKKYPNLKLPKRCFDKHMDPNVTLTMGDVESYFKKRKLNIKKFIYRSHIKTGSNSVEEKETIISTKQKTVAPLKISLKVVRNNQQSNSTDKNYACTRISQKRGRKRKIPVTDNDQCSKSKIIGRNIPITSELVPASIANTPESETPAMINSSLVTANVATVTTPQPIIPIPVSQIDTNIEKTDEKSLLISETTTTSITSKPEFIESLGLIPRVVTTKSQKLLVCKVCGSVHNNRMELKCHSKKHMLCQFCKRKFKSIKTKQNHVDKWCKVKKVMNLPEPFITVEKVHLNLDIRRKYADAFLSFDSIPGLVEPAPLEQVILEAASSPPDVAADGIILLSDDEASASRSSDPFSGIATSLANMPVPAVKNSVYDFVSQIKPDIKIKNNEVFNRITAATSDKSLITDIIKLTRLNQSGTCDQILQTDVPNTGDIKINEAEVICELKDLKEVLMTHDIPVKFSNGKFKVNYQLRKDSKSKKTMDLWDDLPVINQYDGHAEKSTTTLSENGSSAHQNENRAVSRSNEPPLNRIAVTESATQVISTSVATFSTAASGSTITVVFSTLPHWSTTAPISSSSSQKNSTDLANVQATTSSPTSSASNCSLRKSPVLVVNKSIGIQKTYGAVKNIVPGQLSHPNIPNVNGPVLGSCLTVRPEESPANASFVNGSLSVTSASVGVPPSATNLSGSASAANASTTQPIKFRVKKVWELQ